MVIELEVINQLGINKESKGTSRYIPQRIFQKKTFVTENMHIEEHINSMGKILKNFTTVKYDNEFYKLNIPYKKLKEQYFTPIVVKGFLNRDA